MSDYFAHSENHAGIKHDLVEHLKARCLEDRRAFNLNLVTAPALDAT